MKRSTKVLISAAVVTLLAIVGAGTYFVVDEQSKARKAEELQLQEARDARAAEEKRLEEEQEAADDAAALAEAEKEVRESMIRSSVRDVKQSIRDEYMEAETPPTSVGCTRVSTKIYECVVEYWDSYFEESASDLVEAKINPNNGSFVWSEK